MLLSIILTAFIGLNAAAPASSRLHHKTTQYSTVKVHGQAVPPPPPTEPEACLDGTRPNEVYIISDHLGLCGPDALEPCTSHADRVDRLCGDTCVNAVDSTTGLPADMYGLSHPMEDGGFFILYNGTHCEQDTMYLRYAAQRVGTGPVRYVQATDIRPMEVSPFGSFRYYPVRDQAPST